MTKTVFILALAFITLGGGYVLRATPAAAQSHADICQANYEQCVSGCSGFASCISQCETNKAGCNAQGQ